MPSQSPPTPPAPFDEEDWKDDDFLSLENNASDRVDDDADDGGYGDGQGGYDSMDVSSGDEGEGGGGGGGGPVLPPWLDEPIADYGGSGSTGGGNSSVHPLTVLHNEVVGFCRLMEPTQDEMKKREALIDRIRDLIHRTFNDDGEDGDDGDNGGDGENNDNKVKVQVFGSQATGLFLPTSDIDIVIVTADADDKKSENDNDNNSTAKKGGGGSKKKGGGRGKGGGGKKGGGSEKEKGERQNDEEEEEVEEDDEDDWEEHYLGRGSSSSSSSSPLQRFAAALRDEWGSRNELSYLEVIENTRIPLVKFTHSPTDISVDVCFDQPNGPPAAQLMKTFLEALPPLRPLTFVVKYFLKARGLNEPYTGGVGSFALQLLIVAFLQHRERDAVNYSRQGGPNSAGGAGSGNLGSLLLEFFELYGVDFNYVTTGISVRHDGFFFPKGAASRKPVFWNASNPFMCALENPLDTTMDVGKGSFRIQTVQRAFALAYRMLVTVVAEPAVVVNETPWGSSSGAGGGGGNSILATILRPTPEMFARRLYKKKLRPLSSKRGGLSGGETTAGAGGGTHTRFDPRKRQRTR